jgi:hypothetical protein
LAPAIEELYVPSAVIAHSAAGEAAMAFLNIIAIDFNVHVFSLAHPITMLSIQSAASTTNTQRIPW